MSDSKPKRRVALTVDVEAHPIRAAKDHVNRLIWGRQQGREAGIQTMMDIADKHGVTMTFFLDYPEAELYGEELMDVGREIHRRGHDLEPHCHTEYLMKPLFGLEDPLAVRVTKANLSESLKIADYLAELHTRLTGEQASVHRSGAYMLGSHYLDALQQCGFYLDTSYNPLCTENPMQLGIYSAFQWQNGLHELPVPIVPFFHNAPRLVPWNFNDPVFIRGSQQENLHSHLDFLKTYFARFGDAAVPTLIMRSWSFWKADHTEFFSVPDDSAVELFDQLLTVLVQEYDIVPVRKIASEEWKQQTVQEKIKPEFFAVHCPVCFEPASHFQDYNAPKRRCPFCGSVERHRTLVDLVYQGAFGPNIFRNKDILHIAPGWAEHLLLRRMAGARITTLNVLPGCNLQADISSMPEVADNSYDIVLASEVFRHVQNLDAALAEIRRVLRPGGLLFCSDCLENADYGYEITDIEEQTSCYDQEKLKQYGIGDFRRFGQKDWEKRFEPYFYTRLFKIDDQATSSPAWWLACTPKPDEALQHEQNKPVLTPAILRSNAGRIFFDAARNPISTFLPGFDTWQEYRHSFVCNDLICFKKNIFSMYFWPLEPLKQEFLFHGDFQQIYPADLFPYHTQSFTYLLPHLLLDPYFEDSTHLRHIVSEIEDWIDTYKYYAESSTLDYHTRLVVWHDSSVAMRCNFMVYTIIRIIHLPQYDDILIEKILRSALDHFLLLCADHFFNDRHNHGLVQILGLLTFVSALPSLNEYSSISLLVIARLQTLLASMVSSEGIMREHSPGYHALILPLLTDIALLLSDSTSGIFLPEQIKKISTTLTHFIKPNCTLVPFGDTPPDCLPIIRDTITNAFQCRYQLPPLKIFPKSGYAFIHIKSGYSSNKSSYLALQGAFHSKVHKHCDDLSFVWSEGLQDILVDSGQQHGYHGKLHSGSLWEKGFYYSAPNRVYSESVHAHNCVEINGESYSRRIKPYGALPLSGGQLSESCWYLQGEWQRPEGFRQVRKLVFSPARWLLIIDDLQPIDEACPSATTFSEWFHFDASLDLISHSENSVCLKLPDGRQLHCQNFASGWITTHKGEIFPRLQGWQAVENIYYLDPTWAIGIHQFALSASFCTLCSLVGPCMDVKKYNDHYEIQFTDGKIVRFTSTLGEKL